MTIFLILLYFSMCFIPAYLGNKDRLGYWGWFRLSIIFTPLVGIIIAIFLKDNPQ